MSGAAADAGDRPLATLRASLALLFTRRFGTFWFATLASNIGTWAQLVAQPWLLLGLGASPFLVGLDSFAMDAPVLALTLVGGLLADRADRRRVITLFQSIQMLCPALIVILLLRDVVQPWMVIALSLVVGITDALSMPSFQSIVPSIVAPGQLAAGLALNSSQFNLSRILGPMLAGILIAGTGLVGCFVASAVSYLPFILIALWILPRTGRPAAAIADGEAGHPFGGLGAVLRDGPLRGALLTVLATSALCGPLVIFCPVLVKQALHGGATEFTGAISAFGVGGLLGAFALLSVDERHDRRRLSNRFAMTYGLVVVLAALTPWLWSLPLLLVVAGSSMSISNTSANTVLLTQADARLRGRTVSLFMLAVRGGNALGGVLSGLSVAAFGVREALLFNGVLALAAHLALSRSWPRASADI